MCFSLPSPNWAASVYHVNHVSVKPADVRHVEINTCSLRRCDAVIGPHASLPQIKLQFIAETDRLMGYKWLLNVQKGLAPNNTGLRWAFVLCSTRFISQNDCRGTDSELHNLHKSQRGKYKRLLRDCVWGAYLHYCAFQVKSIKL